MRFLTSIGMKTLDMIKQGTKAYYSYMVGYGPEGYNVEKQGYIAYQDVGFKVSQCFVREYDRVVATSIRPRDLIAAVFSFIYSSNKCSEKNPEIECERYKERWMQDSDGRVVAVAMSSDIYPLSVEYDYDGKWWARRKQAKNPIDDIPGINMNTIRFYQEAHRELFEGRNSS